jgi:glutathione S-transferase
MELISKRGCPFAQRTRMVLAVKGLDVTVTEIDLAAPPARFQRISPLRKVPVLVHEGRALVESTVIDEYLDECFPAPALLPSDPGDRARLRFLVDFDETRLVPAFYRLLLAAAGAARERATARFLEELDRFESLALVDASPFVFGDEPTLADLSPFPHLQRLRLLDGTRGLPVPDPDRPLSRWLTAVGELAAVQQASPSAQVMRDDLAPYLDGSADGATVRDLGPRTAA